MISYDPNLRLSLWNSLNRARDMILVGLKYADIVKMSQNELEFITGRNELKESCESIVKKYNTKLIFITLGPEGAFYYHKNGCNKIGTLNVKAIDTTGAGDIFTGAVLHRLLEYDLDLDNLNKQLLDRICWFANVAGALSTTKTGGISSIPRLDEILKVIE